MGSMLTIPPVLPAVALLAAACAAADPEALAPQSPQRVRVPVQADADQAGVPSSATAPRSALEIRWLPPAVARHAEAIDLAAARHGVDPRLVAIIVLVESNGESGAISALGARGLMQVMPQTAADIAHRHALPPPTPAGLETIETNLDLGARLLAELIADFGDPSLDAESVHRVATAYNGGSGVVLGRRAASEETERYAARVVALWLARGEVEAL